jgi:alpha-1,3/alpha-1,6-mannosyltransferase
VDVYTAYYDPARCFEETRSGAFRVAVAGGWFPRSVAGRLHALCAYIRCVLVALRIAWVARDPARAYDVVIADQVSAVVPVLKALTRARVLFYCHFPDLLLASPRSLLHSLYRAPLNWVEQATTGMADRVLVNSAFTRGVFDATFPRLAARGVAPAVLHPAVAVPSEEALRRAGASWREALPAHVARLVDGGPTFLSINRFERKKGIPLAVEALHLLVAREGGHDDGVGGPRLVIAGGYDSRLAENVQHLRELGALAATLGVRDRVAFLPSFTDAQRAALLAAALAVVYTPQGEHFGIVPLEAMAARRPVVACASGGPLESVADGRTGFLREPAAEAWAEAMRQLMVSAYARGGATTACVRSVHLGVAPFFFSCLRLAEGAARLWCSVLQADGVAEQLGAQAREHVQARFSRTAFGDRLNAIVVELAGSKEKKKKTN